MFTKATKGSIKKQGHLKSNEKMLIFAQMTRSSLLCLHFSYISLKLAWLSIDEMIFLVLN